jgi:cysteine-rich repeat protein
MPAGDPDDLGFRPELDIALAHASDPLTPFKPDDLPGSDFTIVAHDGIASGAGNRVVEDYDLVFTVDAPFSFPGGGLIISVTNPKGVLADTTLCRLAITADTQPSGTNRLVGTFTQEVGEYPWLFENTINTPNVPYVRITWTRCGDGRVSGTEVCDDGNTDDTDGCARCQPARCGDGFVQTTEECDDGNADNTDDCANVCKRTVCGDGFVQAQEECDNSANPDHPDPFCRWASSRSPTSRSRASACSSASTTTCRWPRAPPPLPARSATTRGSPRPCRPCAT